MRLNEKALDDFCRAWSITCLPGISVFMSAFFKAGRQRATRARREDLAATRSNTQQIMDYYDSSLETAIDHEITLSFNRFYLTSARRWKRACAGR